MNEVLPSRYDAKIPSPLHRFLAGSTVRFFGTVVDFLGSINRYEPHGDRHSDACKGPPFKPNEAYLG